MPLPDPAVQPVVAFWPDAARALGIRSRATAFRMANQGRLPVRIIHVGRKWAVSTVELREVLGARIDELHALLNQPEAS